VVPRPAAQAGGRQDSACRRYWGWEWERESGREKPGYKKGSWSHEGENQGGAKVFSFKPEMVLSQNKGSRFKAEEY
jgi:hypothetical protein